MLDQVTGVLITLNEEANIEACLASLRASGVKRCIVVDASSQDRTVELARRAGAEVQVVERAGCGYQRGVGAGLVDSEFVLMLDADNRFFTDTVKDLVVELIADRGSAGISPTKVAVNTSSYWAKSWSADVAIGSNPPGTRLVIGTPALFRSAIIKEIGYDASLHGSEDTDLCLRLGRAGWRVSVHQTLCGEEMCSSFSAFRKKLLWYGRGDWAFSRTHPDRKWSIMSHPFRTYLVRRSLSALRRGQLRLLPFYFLFAFFRSLGFSLAAVGFFRRSHFNVQ